MSIRSSNFNLDEIPKLGVTNMVDIDQTIYLWCISTASGNYTFIREIVDHDCHALPDFLLKTLLTQPENEVLEAAKAPASR